MYSFKNVNYGLKNYKDCMFKTCHLVSINWSAAHSKQPKMSREDRKINSSIHLINFGVEKNLRHLTLA